MRHHEENEPAQDDFCLKQQRFHEVTLLCPVLWLNRARPGRRGVLGAKLSTPATALALLEAGRGSARVLQGQSKAFDSFGKPRLGGEKSLALQFKFMIVFSYSDFLVLSPMLTVLCFELSQRVSWQGFRCMHRLLCPGISEDGLTWCGEACASLLYFSFPPLSLWPVPWVPWLQQRWTSSLCQKFSLCLRSGPVKHGPGTRALDDLLGIQMASAA